MTGPQKGYLYAALAALSAAGFLIPFKAAAALAARPAIVVAMLLCAAVLNTATGFAKKARRRAAFKVTALSVVVLGALTVAGNVGVAAALSLQEPAVTAVLLQVQIFIVAVTELVFLREKITGRFAVGAALAVAGFAVMHVVGTGASTSAAGIGWAMMAATSFALMHVFTRAVIERIDAVWVNAWRLWLAVSILLLWPGNVAAVMDLSVNVWLLALAAAALGPFLSRLCLMWTVRYIPASRATLVAMINPLFALFFGAIAFGAIPSGRELGGGLLILAGVAIPLLERASRATSRPTRPTV